MKAKALNILTLITLLSLMCVTSRAQLIYSNNFSLGGAENISNTPPTVANSFAGGTNTALWNDVLGTNNTAALLANGIQTTTLGDSFLLPFIPQAGHVYSLTATVTFTNNPGNWIGLGFAQNDVSNVANSFARFSDNQTGGTNSPRGSDWMILTESTGNIQYFAGPGTGPVLANLNGAFTPGPGTSTVSVILNTMNSLWSVASYVNGVQLGTNYTYAANPTIRGVGITQSILTAPTAVQWNNLAFSASQQPFITRQPASQSVTVATAYTNTVVVTVATNSGTLFYQWYANGAPLTNGTSISGANTNVLVINPVSTNNAGTNYYVVVTNSYGAVTSSVSSLTIVINPVFTALFPIPHTNPITLFGGENIDGMSYLGSTPTFSVSVTGASPLVYQWLTNGVAVAGAASASFTFANCQLSGPTNFTCIVSNSFGVVSNTWSAAYIATPPAPYPQSVLASQPVAFWRLNEASGTLCDDYESANNGIYTNVALGQAGYNPAEPAETSAAFALGATPIYSYAGHIQGVDFAVTNGANAEFAVEAWAVCYGNVPGSPVVSEGTYAVNEEFGLGSSSNSTALYQFYVRAASGTVYKAVSTVTVNDGNWHHLVGVCDEANSNVLLYVDGQLAASATIPAQSGIYEASSPLVIGAGIISGQADYTLEFNGNVSDVAAYKYALSAGQVVAHYASFGNEVPLAFVPPLPSTNVFYGTNQTLTISAAASGTAPFGYYWTNVTAGGLLSSGATTTSGTLNATLTIPNAAAGLNGDQLELVVTNATSSTNLFVTLVSLAPPVTLSYTSPILYSNDFDGGTWSIAGMPLTAANSLVGGTNATWIDVEGTNSLGIIQANGIDADTSRDSWVVPFTPHAGYVYTINASLTFAGSPGNWVGLGFAQTIPTNTAVANGRFSDLGTASQPGPVGYDWLIMTESSGQLEYFAGPTTGTTITNKAAFFTAGTGTHTVQVILDTTGTNWVAYAYVDGVSAGTNTYNATNNPSIGAVGITQTDLAAPGNVQWNSFALSQVAPTGVPPYLLNPLPPTNSITLTNGTVTIPATAFGSAPFGYTWNNNSTVIASGSTGTMAPLSAGLSISGSSLSAGQLELIVTNAYGTNITIIPLVSTVNPNPGSIQYSVTGNQLTLNWPTNLGWTLQAQTNSLAVGISTNWVNVANSSTTNQMVVPVNTANGSVFYRLILP